MTHTRRAFLAATGAVTGLAATAGCLDSGNGGFALGDEDVLPVPVAGDPDADVTVMVFEDFSCPACRQFKTSVYPQLRTAHIDPGEIRYEHRDFPMTVSNEWSWGIASAARSVQEQAGDEAFWGFTERIYRYQGAYSNEAIVEVVEELNEDEEYEIDPNEVVDAVEDERYRDDIETEADRASDAGVSSTPTVVVDGSQVESSYDAIESAIEDAR